jgi:hypothetical protein
MEGAGQDKVQCGTYAIARSGHVPLLLALRIPRRHLQAMVPANESNVAECVSMGRTACPD